MKNQIKKIVLFSIIIICGVGIYFGNKKLKDEKRWFYSTGTNEVVFGDITWGMSQQEVERSLGEKLSKKIFKFDLGLQIVKGDGVEIDFTNIVNQNFLITEIDLEKNKIPKPIISKIKRLFSKPLDNMLGIETGSVIYLFYNDKLFSVSFLPNYAISKIDENTKSTFEKFKNKTNHFNDLLLKNLQSKFGSLVIKNDIYENLESISIENKTESNYYLDGIIFRSLENGSFDNTYYKLFGNIQIRYKPIIEEINKDKRDLETSFFK